MDGGIAIFVNALLSLLAIALGLIALRLSAGWLGAGTNSWGACVLALIIPWLVGIVCAVAGGAIGLAPWLLVIVILLVQMFAVAKVLETTLPRAIGITLLATILTAAVMLGLGVLLSAVFGLGALTVLGFGAQQQGRLDALEAISPDKSAVSITVDEAGTETSEVTLVPLAPAPSAAPETTTPPASPPARKAARYAYQEIPISSLGPNIRRGVRILLKDGRQRQGTLIDVKGNVLSVKHRTHGGSFEYQVEAGDIEKLEIWAREN